MYNLRFEPPMDPPELEVAFDCDDCGCEIYVEENYYHANVIEDELDLEDAGWYFDDEV